MIHHNDNCPVKPKCTCGFAKQIANAKAKLEQRKRKYT